jgi:putative DNA primase/helicase
VVILPDNDPPGRAHATQVAQAFVRHAASIKVVTLPDLPAHGDISDWVARGGTREALLTLIDETPLWYDEPTPSARPSPPGGEEQDTPLPYSDYTNALALVREHGEDLRYCHPWGKWLRWSGTHWQEDQTWAVMRDAKATIIRMARRAETMEEPEETALVKHVKSSLSTGKLKAMLESAQSEEGIYVLPETLDQDPWLLNCLNGTVDLRTGQLHPHRREDFLTRRIAVEYHAHASP